MPIYDSPTKTLMREYVEAEIRKGRTFKKEDAVTWFFSRDPGCVRPTARLQNRKGG